MTITSNLWPLTPMLDIIDSNTAVFYNKNITIVTDNKINIKAIYGA